MRVGNTVKGQYSDFTFPGLFHRPGDVMEFDVGTRTEGCWNQERVVVLRIVNSAATPEIGHVGFWVRTSSGKSVSPLFQKVNAPSVEMTAGVCVRRWYRYSVGPASLLHLDNLRKELANIHSALEEFNNTDV